MTWLSNDLPSMGMTSPTVIHMVVLADYSPNWKVKTVGMGQLTTNQTPFQAQQEIHHLMTSSLISHMLKRCALRRPASSAPSSDS